MEQRNDRAHENQSLSIDRTSYEPAYVQLVNILRHQMATGVFLPGDQLPSESELRRGYQVSPMTVRRAINILADQGTVTTQQGRGTFVKPMTLGAATFDLRGMLDLLRDERTAVKILETRIVSAVARTARKLGVYEGARVIFIRRLLSHAGEPVLYHREYLIYDPTRPLVEAELEVTSLRGLFDGTGGTDLKWGELSIEAATLDQDEAHHLQGAVGSPAIYLEHIFYDFDDQPASWGWFISCSDRMRFTGVVGIRE